MERDPPKNPWGQKNLAEEIKSSNEQEALRLASLANQRCVIVEVGAGTGAMAWFLAKSRKRLATYLGLPDLAKSELKCTYWATDLAADNSASKRLLLLSKAPKQQFEVECETKPSDVDACNLDQSFPQGSVDVVLSVCCWGYGLNSTFVASALRVLKPNGKIVMFAPTNILFNAGRACFAGRALESDEFFEMLIAHNERNAMRLKRGSKGAELVDENCNRRVEQSLQSLFALCDSQQIDICLSALGSHEYMANNFTSSAIDSKNPHEGLRGWNTCLVIRRSHDPRILLWFKGKYWLVPRPQ